MAKDQKFFEVIKPHTNLDFIGRQHYWIIGSIILVLISIGMLPLNAYVLKGRGHMLNWGVDFRGGTEMVVEFSKPVEAGDVRAAMDAGGYHGTEVVRYNLTGGPGGGNKTAYMIRMGAVSVLSPQDDARAQAALA